MKKLLYYTLFVIILGSFSGTFAYQTISTQRMTTDIRYNNSPIRASQTYNIAKPSRRIHGDVYTPHVHVPAYHRRSFNGFEHSRFHRRSYYIPSYCMPGSAFHSEMHNPFCSQYYPYGSGFYTGF